MLDIVLKKLLILQLHTLLQYMVSPVWWKWKHRAQEILP